MRAAKKLIGEALFCVHDGVEIGINFGCLEDRINLHTLWIDLSANQAGAVSC